jgi:hypothetical protein
MSPRNVVAAAAQNQHAEVSGRPSAIADPIGDASELPRLRIHRDGRIEQIISEGLSTSPTFREVVNRLNRSNVVVYVRCQKDMANREDGYLKFVGSAAGYRYLQAHIRYNISRPHQIALIGHELFHAAEVADAPSVIDVASFEREYARIGFVSRTIRIGGGIAYDTHAAIRAGEQILREMTASPKQRLLANIPSVADDDRPAVSVIGGEPAVE